MPKKARPLRNAFRALDSEMSSYLRMREVDLVMRDDADGRVPGLTAELAQLAVNGARRFAEIAPGTAITPAERTDLLSKAALLAVAYDLPAQEPVAS